MCGFAGILSGDGLREDALTRHVSTMIDPITHRGPDAAGVWTDERAGIALGFRRLAILDLSPLGSQPMISASGRYVIAFNGEIYNYKELRADLIARGHRFTTQSDTEVIVHQIFDALETSGNFVKAVKHSIAKLEGAYALGIMSTDHPDTLIACRKGSPLVIGVGIGEYFIASDVAALLPVTQRFIFLEDGDIAVIAIDDLVIFDKDDNTVSRPIKESQLTAEAAEKGEYRHYMLKEIYEQPFAISQTLEGRFINNRLQENAFGHNAATIFDGTKAILILACGTSYHAGLVARYWLEELARVPCSIEVASEFRYRNPVLAPDTLVVTISQSGETADTLAALQEAKKLGAKHSLTICNVPESALVRQTDLRFLTRAGPEIGVASTKAFTTQLSALYLLTLVIARLRGRLGAQAEKQHLDALRHLPAALRQVLALEPQVAAWAKTFASKQHALFLGRGMHFPIALEGALKLKEISYIHAEAYAAGELKHGPLALVDKDMPVVAIAPNDALLEKLKSNLQEVRARGGELFVFADADSQLQSGDGVHVIRMTEHAGPLSPILHTVPLQLLAYHVALVKGTDVDKPRNLAKSVTVE